MAALFELSTTKNQIITLFEVTLMDQWCTTFGG